MSAVASPALAAPARSEVWPWLRDRLDLFLLGLLMLALLFLPKGIPGGPAAVRNLGGIAGLGVVNGATLALQGVGVVLILRATRVFNFGQVQLGAISGLVFFELIHHTQFVLLAYVACPGCFHGLPADTTYLQAYPATFMADLFRHGYGNLVAINFWLSLAVSFLIAPVLSWVTYMLVIRRFENAPRLIVAIVTLAMADVLVSLANLLPEGLFQDVRNDNNVIPIGIGRNSVLPDIGCHAGGTSCGLYIQPALFHIGDVLTVVVALVAIAALAAFFVFSSRGIAMRGAADNPKRAQTLGISVASLSAFSWLLAGALSGLAAVLAVISSGSGGVSQAGFEVSPLVQVLAAVVIARLTNMPLVVIGAVCLGIINQVFFWNFSTSVWFDGFLLVIIGGILLLQQSRQSRAEQEASAGYLAAKEARPIPRELRSVPVVDAWVRWAGLIVAALVLGYPFVMNPAQVSLGSVILIFTIIGLSLLVLTGWAGQISLGQFAFAAVGGYVAAIVAARTGLFFLIPLLVGGVAGAIVAMLVGVPALRLRGLYLAVTTLAFALATSSVLLNPDALGRFLPATLDRPSLLGFDLNDERVFYYLSLGFVVLAAATLAGLRRSRTARALIACRDNEQAAQSLGINLFRARLEAFAISGFLAAFAGALFAYHEHGVEPVAFAPGQSIEIFTIVVIGGLGSLLGPLLGSIYYGVFVLFNNPILQIAAGGVGVLFVLMIFPGGLSAMAYAVRDAWLRRVAVRYRIVVPSLLADVRENALESQAMIAPKTSAGGGTAFVPQRYRLEGQWDKFEEPPP